LSRFGQRQSPGCFLYLANATFRIKDAQVNHPGRRVFREHFKLSARLPARTPGADFTSDLHQPNMHDIAVLGLNGLRVLLL
jgi:hypothetical protein